jgi:cation transport ATPase
MCADTCLSRRVHSGMTCQACVNRVEAALLSVSGVSAVSVDLASGVGFAPCFTLE